MKLTLIELREISGLVNRVSSALVPLAADGIGSDSHGGASPTSRSCWKVSLGVGSGRPADDPFASGGWTSLYPLDPNL